MTGTSDVRYGIFLRPDPATCWTITQVTAALRAQFGLVSAGAFPPHATLIGNLRTNASEDALAKTFEEVFATVQPFPVYNSGLAPCAEHGTTTYRYDIDRDQTNQHSNGALRSVAKAVKDACLPLDVPAQHLYSTPVIDYQFAGHLGLASHDLILQPHLADEVGAFIAGLPLQPPPAFTARWYSLYRLHSADWNGHWWQTLTWEHLTSWDTAEASTA